MNKEDISDEKILPPPEYHEAWFAIPEIVKLGDPILRQAAPPITKIGADTRKIVAFMIDVLHKARGLGLAAPQVGISQRLFVYDLGEGVQVAINPQILGMKGEQIGVEGCLSIPGLLGDVPRANELRLKAFDERGRPFTRKASELEARVIQHEYDHLDGVLFFDKVIPETLDWSSLDEEEDDDEGEEELKSRRSTRRRRRGK